jgi:hypothetical protein
MYPLPKSIALSEQQVELGNCLSYVFTKRQRPIKISMTINLWFISWSCSLTFLSMLTKRFVQFLYQTTSSGNFSCGANNICEKENGQKNSFTCLFHVIKNKLNWICKQTDILWLPECHRKIACNTNIFWILNIVYSILSLKYEDQNPPTLKFESQTLYHA